MPLLLRGFTLWYTIFSGTFVELILVLKKMENSGKIEIEKFNGQSFELWKLKMEDLLVDKYQ